MEPDTKAGRPAARWLWTAAAGLVATLAGLAWDGMMHSRDHELAANEGVFTLSNPSHALFVAGLAVTALGIAGGLAPTVRRARRSRLPLVAGAVVVVVAAGAVGAWASIASDGHTHEAAQEAVEEEDGSRSTAAPQGHAHDAADVPAATAEQRVAAEQLLESTIASTLAYRDSSAAEADGYRFGAVEMADKLIYHVPNPAYQHDGHILDPERPESLLYAQSPADGTLVLVGVVYRMQEPGVPGLAVGGPITIWHNHTRCIDPAQRGEAIATMDGTCPAGMVPYTGVDMMHVWFTDDLATAFNGRLPPIADLIAYQRNLAEMG